MELESILDKQFAYDAMRSSHRRECGHSRRGIGGESSDRMGVGEVGCGVEVRGVEMVGALIREEADRIIKNSWLGAGDIRKERNGQGRTSPHKGEKGLRRPVNAEHFAVGKKRRGSRAAENEAGEHCSCARVGHLAVFRHCCDFESSCAQHKSISAAKRSACR